MIMCLSTVVALQGDEKTPVARNVAGVKQEDGKLILTDIMGRTTMVDADIERIDLLENYIWIRRR